MTFPSLRLAPPLSLASLALACGGAVDQKTDSVPAATNVTPGVGVPPNTPPGTPPVVPASVPCAAHGSIVTFDGTIVDLAADATDVWALLARKGTWALDKAPKCGGAITHVGDAPTNTQAAGPPRPTRLALSDGQGAIVEWWDGGPTLSLTGFGAASRVKVTTLYGPSIEPMALAIGTDAAYTAIDDQLRQVTLADGSFGQPSWDPLVPPSKSGEDYVHDLCFDAGSIYGATSGRVVSLDTRTKAIVRSGVLLMSGGPRFVRAFKDAVYVIGADIAKLPRDLSTFELFHLSEQAPVVDVVIHERGLFFTKARRNGNDEVYRIGLNGGQAEALPAIPGNGGQLAIDETALYVGRGSSVERIPLE